MCVKYQRQIQSQDCHSFPMVIFTTCSHLPDFHRSQIVISTRQSNLTNFHSYQTGTLIRIAVTKKTSYKIFRYQIVTRQSQSPERYSHHIVTVTKQSQSLDQQVHISNYFVLLHLKLFCDRHTDIQTDSHVRSVEGSSPLKI